MKNLLYISVVVAFSFGANPSNKYGGALDWYGYNALLSTDLYTQDHFGGMEEDEVFRKRRHRRRRKIGPSKKGW